MQNEIYWLWLLAIKGIGPMKHKVLLQKWGNAEHLFYETPQQVEAFMKKESIFSARDYQAFCDSKNQLELCHREWERLQKEGVEILTQEQSRYPQKLKEVVDAPPAFFVKGRWKEEPINDGLTLAVVGTRRITPYGREVAVMIGKLCAEHGIPLISGMAVGVDGAAHRACLKHGGYSIGVLTSGLGHQFPASNRDLYLDMEEAGCLISEERYQTPPLANLFPKRNRIISGLADAVIIVEAAEKSGSLIPPTLLPITSISHW